ncbi:MAG: hypothetical protein JWP40_1317 [Blastococcus sp.]|nr:hypothetical protein [Blastococcus sp.]
MKQWISHPYFRLRDVETGLLHGHIRWPEGRPPTPYGCRWCGEKRGHHGRQYLRSKGIHGWERPTEAQILARMRARRRARGCRCHLPYVDPYRCEADDCSMHNYLLGLWMTPLSAADAMGLARSAARTNTTGGTNA